MDLKIVKIVVGEMETNCYLLSSEKSALVIDPGDEAEEIIKKIGSKNIEYILLTHGHYDHLLALRALAGNFPGAKICLGEKDIPLCQNLSKQNNFCKEKLADLHLQFTGLKENQKLPFASREITVLETPGHTDGSVCYLVGEHLFSGDTLFRGSYGRTDLPTGNQELMAKSLKKLSKLDEKLRVYPGHGPMTTIQEEKRFGFLS